MKRLIELLLNYPLYIISYFIPTKKKIWIFGAWYGKKYFDNSKYLFEYIKDNHREIEAWWMTSNKEIYIEYQNKINILYKYSLKGLVYALQSHVVIITHSIQVDLFPFMNNKKKIKVQLWHGIPIKKIGHDDMYGYGRKSIIKQIKNFMFPFDKDRFDLIISSSDEDKKNMSSAFRANINKVIVTGYPRNDDLSYQVFEPTNRILYAPTLRDGIGKKIDLFSGFGFNIKKMNEFLIKEDLFLDIKMHPVNELDETIKQEIENYERINLLPSLMEINDKLKKYKMLISDYSGIYIDYLLLNRPIIFAPFDFEKYLQKNRQLYFDYDFITPGPKCRNWAMVLDSIKDFQNNHLNYHEERIKIKNLFHNFEDGLNSMRVYDCIIKSFE